MGKSFPDLPGFEINGPWKIVFSSDEWWRTIRENKTITRRYQKQDPS